MRTKIFPALCLLSVMVMSLPAAGETVSYSGKDGLVHNEVRCFFQDGRGYLWIGTGNGVSRFDGEAFDNWPLRHPIAGGEVESIVEDRGGSLWIVTGIGLWRIRNGRAEALLKADGLADDAVTCCIEDRRGRIWIGTKRGLTVHENEAFGLPPASRGTPPSKRINVIYEDRGGGIWVGTRMGGLALFRDGSWTTFGRKEGLGAPIVNDVCQDASGAVWIATHSGVSVYRDGALGPAPFAPDLPVKIIHALFFDEDGRLWMRAVGPGVLLWDGKVLRSVGEEEGLAGKIVKDIVQDGSGDVWIGTTQGLSRLPGGNPPAVRTVAGLPSDFVRRLFVDRESNVWVGTDGGMCKVQPPRIRVVAEDGGAPRPERLAWSRGMYRDEAGTLWFPTASGLGAFDGGETVLFSTENGLPHPSVCLMEERGDGGLWLATPEGLCLLLQGKVQAVEDPLLAGRPMRAMAAAGGRTLFVCEDNTVVLHDGEAFSAVSGSGEGFWSYSIASLEVDRAGGFWMGTTAGFIYFDGRSARYITLDDVVPDEIMREGWMSGTPRPLFTGRRGVALFDDGSFRYIPFTGDIPEGALEVLGTDGRDRVWLRYSEGGKGRDGTDAPAGLLLFDGTSFVRMTEEDGLASNDARSFFEDASGTVWIRTDGGIGRFDGGRFTSFSRRDGLASDRVRSLLRDGDGSVWMGTEFGVSRLRDGIVTTFSVADGLLDANVMDLQTDADGDLWIRTATGVHRYRARSHAPRIDLVSLTVGGAETPLKPPLELAHDQNSLRFDYRGISFTEGRGNLRYFYQLQGHSEEWFGPIGESHVTFHSLNPGEYVFRVKAINRDLHESKAAASFAFVIAPPFWLTWWFVALSAIAVFSLGYAFYRIRLSANLEKERMRHELQTAHEMQMGLMPDQDPEVPGFDVSGFCQTADEVGGDYYDFFWVDDEETRFGIAVADVTGKAMKASIVAVMTSGMIHTEINNQERTSGLTESIEQSMFVKTGPPVFTTMLFAVLDVKERVLTFANAGHMYPMVLRNGEVSYIGDGKSGLPLGLTECIELEEVVFELKAGDTVLFYTDGFTEATDAHRKILGFDRMAEMFRAAEGQGARETIDSILAGIRDFVGGAPQHDDITLVAVKVK